MCGVPVAGMQDAERTVDDLRLVDADRVRHAGGQEPQPRRRRPPGRRERGPRVRRRARLTVRNADLRMIHPAQPCTMIRSMAHAFTVGVEEEFQIVDPETWELRSHVSELLASSARRSAIRSSARCTSRSSRSAPRSAPTSTSSSDGDHPHPRAISADAPSASACASPPPARIRSRAGWTRSSPPASATRTSSKSCSSWPDRC